MARGDTSDYIMTPSRRRKRYVSVCGTTTTLSGHKRLETAKLKNEGAALPRFDQRTPTAIDTTGYTSTQTTAYGALRAAILKSRPTISTGAVLSTTYDPLCNATTTTTKHATRATIENRRHPFVVLTQQHKNKTLPSKNEQKKIYMSPISLPIRRYIELCFILAAPACVFLLSIRQERRPTAVASLLLKTN